MRGYFSQQQKSVRKDVERCFGVLQARFAIIRNLCHQWSIDVIDDIKFTCCILHNMIVKNEKDEFGLKDIVTKLLDSNLSFDRDLSFEDLVNGPAQIQDVNSHFGLRDDLIEHLWALKGDNMF